MPKTKRGHHSTKRSGKAKIVVRNKQPKAIHFEPAGERMRFACTAPLENRIPLA